MSETAISRRAAGLGLFAAAMGTSMVASAARAADGQIYFLQGARVVQAGTDGAGVHTLCTGKAGGLNDGIAYDPVGKRIYWTNMGKASADDGWIQSCKLDGSDLQMVVQPGGTFTPKQMKIDAAGRKMYWSDREGMRVMRANIDGSNIEVLVQTGSGDADRKDLSRWCVGIAVDTARGHVYWSQKGGDNAGQGTIKRCGINLPKGQTPTDRKDIEVLFSHLPEPIDLDLDLKTRSLYWTDRGDNTVSRAPMDPPKGFDPANRKDRKILVGGLHEFIGISLDLPNKRMFYTSLGGEVGTSGIDGSNAKLILQNQGGLTGIIYLA